MSALIYFAIPESPHWLLRKGQPLKAADIVNRIIQQAGSTVQPLTVAALGAAFTLLGFARHRPARWTTVGYLHTVGFGRETVGQLETVTEDVPALA